MRPIVQHLRQREEGDIIIIKTKAHAERKTFDDDRLQWEAFCNAMADRQAKFAITKDNYTVHDMFGRIHSREQERRLQMVQFAQYMAEISELACKRTCQERRISKNEFDLQNPLLRQPAEGQSHGAHIPEELLLSFPWGPIFLWRMMQWSNKLRWSGSRGIQ